MDKINKLTLPATILIASIILGGFYYASQVSKQQSIEKQQQIDLQAKAVADQVKADQQTRADQVKIAQDQADKEARKEAQQIDLQAKARAEIVRQNNVFGCLRVAEDNFVTYMRLNGRTNPDGTITTSNYFAISASKNKENDIDNCYKRFK